MLVALALLPLLAVLPPVHADDFGTTTSIVCGPGTLPVDAPSVCTVTVSDAGSGLSAPTGSVVIGSSEPGTFGGPCILSGSGSAAACSVSYTPSPGSEGKNGLSAFYTGDADHGPSAATFDVQVTPRETSTSVSCVAGTQPVGQLTCTATVTDIGIGTAITPTGTVSFSSPAAGAFSAHSCTLVSGSCSVGYTPSAGSGCPSIVTGGYGGDTNHLGGGSGTP